MILVGILGLNLLIFIHEMGHYFFAKLFKVGIVSFSLGFGPKIFKFNLFDTEFCISLIPFGGYCKMKGEDSLKKAFEDNLEYIPKEEHGFYSVNPLKRMFISFGGPLFNVLFAFLIFYFINMLGYSYESYSNKIIPMKEYGAALAGMQNGDRIYSIQSKKMQSYRDIQDAISFSKKDQIKIEYEREGKTFEVYANLKKSNGKFVLGIMPFVPTYVQDLGENEKIAGLKRGDLITEINGTKIADAYSFVEEFNKTSGAYTLKYKRNGVEHESRVLPNLKGGLRYFQITFKEDRFRVNGAGIGNSFILSAKDIYFYLDGIVEGIKAIFSGTIKADEAVSGPIKITYFISEASKEGFQNEFADGIVVFFRMLGILSVALFFGNMLPLPPLDGGAILLSVFQFFSFKEVKSKQIKLYYIFGSVVMLLLLFLGVFSDFSFLKAFF